MVCEGCGLELPARSGRGRRARFHGARCRQRAHRARAAAGEAELLAALDALAGEVAVARRAVLSGAVVPVDVRERIGAQAAMIAVTGGQGLVAGVHEEGGPGHDGTRSPVTDDVTEIVTDSVPVPAAVDEPRGGQASAPREHPGSPVTGKVRKPKHSPAEALRRRAIDPATARLGNRTLEGRYPVLAGPVARPVTIGLVEPVGWRGSGRVKAWRGKLEGVPIGEWSTRAIAAGEVAYAHESRRLALRERDRAEGQRARWRAERGVL